MIDIEDKVLHNSANRNFSRMPKSAIRYGSLIILSVILFVLISSAFIDFPDIIETTAQINTSNALTIQSKNDKKIRSVLVSNEADVIPHQIIATLESDGNEQNIQWLDSVISLNENVNILTDDSIPDWLNLKFWSENAGKVKEIGSITPSFTNLISAIKEYDLAQPVKEVKAKKISTILIEKEKLQTAIKTWKDDNILKSSISGKVFLQRDWKVNDEIKAGQLFCIISNNKDSNITCRMQLLENDYYKLKEKQKVKIFLFKFPEEEYGYLNGEISSLTSLPQVQGTNLVYMVDAIIKTPLTTSKGIHLKYTPMMNGKAEIVINEITLFEKVTNKWFEQTHLK